MNNWIGERTLPLLSVPFPASCLRILCFISEDRNSHYLRDDHAAKITLKCIHLVALSS